MKTKKSHTVGTVPNSNRNCRKRQNRYMTAHLHVLVQAL